MAEEIASSTGNETSHLAKHKDSGGGGSAFQKPTPIKRSFCTHTNINSIELQNNNSNALDKKLTGPFKCTLSTEPENGFLSTLDSVNSECSKTSDSSLPPLICVCTNPANCVTLKNILDSFKAPLSEEQAWAIIYQTIKLYRVTAVNCKQNGKLRIFSDLETPESLINLNMHRDGTVHCSWSSTEIKEKQQKFREEKNLLLDLDNRDYDNHVLVMASQKKILRKVGVIIYTALDYNLQADEQCQMSQELEELITYMTADDSSDDDCIDEGIDEGYKRWDDENDDDKCNETKELDYVLKVCSNHVKPTVPDDHYKAVCRALVTETIELRIFLQQVLNDDTENLRLKADSQTSKQELAKLGFNDWARFWVQVIDELRRGVRLKKNNFSRAPIEYELTPYEILMEDIRSKKYQLRKVMINGDIPPRVKKDAHAVILEFIRSRPPLKKASERKLPPPLKRTPSPREQLMDSIRKGQTLKHIQPPSQPRLRYRLSKKKPKSRKWCRTM